MLKGRFIQDRTEESESVEAEVGRTPRRGGALRARGGGDGEQRDR